MTMAATGLPSATPVPAAAPAAASASTTDVAPTDFLLMLGQLLGAGGPVANGSTKAATTTADADKDIAEATDDAAVFVAPFAPIAPTTPWSQLQPTVASSDEGGDALKSLDLMPLGTGAKADSESKLAPALLDAMT